MLKQILDILMEDVSPTDISSAIENKKQVLINYEDEESRAPGRRIIEPYVYGSLPNGNQVIRGFQYSGDTYRGVPKWKLFRVDRIKSWSETDNSFNQPPKQRGWTGVDYNTSGDRQMSDIYCKVSFSDSELSMDPLTVARNRTSQIRSSQPINIFKDAERRKEEKRKEEFQAMLRRNLEITRREKERRGFSLSKDEEPKTVDGPLPTMDQDDDEFKRTVGAEVGHNETMNEPEQKNDERTEDEIFRDMLKRNLEITRKEKERRGFSFD